MTPRSIALVLAAAAMFSGAPIAHAGKDAGAGQVNRETIAALAGTYTFRVPGAAANGCRVTLHAHGAGMREHNILRTTMNARCRHNVPTLQPLSEWLPTGGGSVRLMGGNPVHTLGEFSPVQDGSGVYLRGEIGDDGKVYELRPVDAQ